MIYDYRGFIHIHSSFSHDGTTNIKDIIKSARNSGADFIVVTDHFNMKTKEEGFEGFNDKLLVICGEEISPSYNHYLAVGIKKPVQALPDEKPQNYIDAVKKDGGIGLIAHPDHTGTPLFGVRSYAWKDWSVEGFDAISIWDLMTDWQEKLTSYSKALFAVLLPSLVLSGPKRVTLERWDKLNCERNDLPLIAGYGEIDNHDFRKKAFNLTFRVLPFDTAFKTVSTHVLLKKEMSSDPQEAASQIIEAIKKSSIYVSCESFNSSKGFEFYISDDMKTAYSGETLIKIKKPIINIKTPQKALIKIIHNGKEIYSSVSKFVSFEAEESGIYRTEIFQKKNFVYRPWIFSNHIRIV